MGIRSLSTASISTGTKRSKVWDQSAVASNVGQLVYESIATTTVGAGGTSTITFSSIPQTYKHLQIRAIAKSTRTSSEQATYKFTFNGDTGANYTYHRLYGEGASVVSSGGGGVNEGYLYWGITTNDTSNTFGASVWDILDYTNTNKNTTVRYFGGLDTNTTANGIGIGSSAWLNTSAVSSISIGIDNSFNFTQYSSFALYGIKG